MDTFDVMKTFVAVADQRSFAKAARGLGLSAPAVSRAVAGLEEKIGAQLLRRTTRSVTLTEAGEHYRDDCRRILADVRAAEAAAGGAHDVPRGELRVTAPRMFGRIHVAPLLAGFLAEHPEISVRGVFEDHIVHLLDDGFDVAIRIARLPDSGLAAVRVGEVRRMAVASPEYLRRRGVPRTPADLAAHMVVAYSVGGGFPTAWEFSAGRGKKGTRGVSITPPSSFSTNSNESAIAAALAGYGIARTLSYQVADAVADGRLQVVLRDYELPPSPVQLVHGGGRRPPAKVRAFVDYFALRLRREPILSGRFDWPATA